MVVVAVVVVVACVRVNAGALLTHQVVLPSPPQRVTQQDKVVHLPCSPSVAKILAAFVEEKKVQCGAETDAFRVWQEVAAGVRLYFERSLGTLLLYVLPVPHCVDVARCCTDVVLCGGCAHASGTVASGRSLSKFGAIWRGLAKSGHANAGAVTQAPATATAASPSQTSTARPTCFDCSVRGLVVWLWTAANGGAHRSVPPVKLPELLERTLLEEPERKALSRRLKAVLVYVAALPSRVCVCVCVCVWLCGHAATPS